MTRTTNAIDIMLAQVSRNPERYASARLAVLAGRTASKIKLLRTAADLSQAEMAEKMAVRQPSVARMESGAYEGLTLKTLNKAAIALGKQLVIEFEDVAPSKAASNRIQIALPMSGFSPSFKTEEYKMTNNSHRILGSKQSV